VALLLAAGLLLAGCSRRPLAPAEETLAAPPGAALLEARCTRCHGLERVLGAGGSEADWAATVGRMQARYGAGAATGLTDQEAALIVDYLAAAQPLEGARRPLRVVGLARPPAAPSGATSGGTGPVEPRLERRTGPDGAAHPQAADRLPAGPDPVLAEGRSPKPLEALAPGLRESVERGAARWEVEGCAGCHVSAIEIRAWAGAFPQVPLFRPEEGVVTLTRAVKHWRRHPGAQVEDSSGHGPEETDLVAYLTWRADGAPMAPGRAYPLPPAADLETLERAVARGRAIAEGEPGRLESGACSGCHPQGKAVDRSVRGRPVPEILGAAAGFPRFVPDLGRVGALEDYLTAHLSLAFEGEPVTPSELGRPSSEELTAVVAHLAWLARDRLVDVGRPAGARSRGSAELGREFYQLRCGICHDPKEQGSGPLGPGLAGLFERGRLPSGRPATPEAVVQTIRSGARGMPAFIDLTAAQLEDLLAYLRTL
jgi:mono/diheme cytochrome c family protein